MPDLGENYCYTEFLKEHLYARYCFRKNAFPVDLIIMKTSNKNCCSFFLCVAIILWAKLNGAKLNDHRRSTREFVIGICYAVYEKILSKSKVYSKSVVQTSTKNRRPTQWRFWTRAGRTVRKRGQILTQHLQFNVHKTMAGGKFYQLYMGLQVHG